MDLNEYAVQFPNIDYRNKIIDFELYELLTNTNIRNILEVGAGNGALAYKVLKEFNHIEKYHCIEPSSIRAKFISRDLSLFNEKLSVYVGYLDDLVLDTMYDLVISEQVLEHVPDDFEFLTSLSKVGSSNTIFYISTVFKKKYSWYFYTNQFGESVLDPTHLREYNSQSINSIITHINDFSIIKLISYRPIFYPISGLLKRLKFFVNFLNNFLYKIKIRIPGYYNLLIIFIKK